MKTKKLLCILLIMATLLAFLPVAAAAESEPGEVTFKVLFQLPNRTEQQNARARRFLSLVVIPYTAPSTNYRLQVNRVEINEDNTLEVFIELIDAGDVGLMVVLDYWAVLYVPLKYAWGTDGVKVTIGT